MRRLPAASRFICDEASGFWHGSTIHFPFPKGHTYTDIRISLSTILEKQVQQPSINTWSIGHKPLNIEWLNWSSKNKKKRGSQAVKIKKRKRPGR